MALIGSLATVRSQTFSIDKFTAAFTYLEELFRADSPSFTRLRTIAVGNTQRVDLSNGAFALEQVYQSKLRCDGFLESHRKYIDVQVVFEGEEWMELVDLNRAIVRHAYDPDRDLSIYAEAPGSSLRVNSGDAAIFYPSDVHMPGLCGASGPALVRKTVIKVPVGT